MLAGVDGTFASCITAPFRVTTHRCVSSIETSRPAKYSMFGLLFRKTEPESIGLRGRATDHYPMLKNGWRGGAGGPADIGVTSDCAASLGGGDCLLSGYKLGQLAEVLGDCSEVEFVAGTARPAQP